MKFLILLLALAAVVHSEQLNSLDNNSAYGYLAKSIKETERILKVEEKILSQQKIIGGVPAAVGHYPYQAGLLSNIVGFEEGRGMCGASLISPNRLASAAHCWFDGVNQAWRVEVVLGSTFIGSGGVRQFTSAFINHPNWQPLLARNDVGVIYLPESIPVSSIIAPVALPSGADLLSTFENEIVLASGFGLTSDDPDVTHTQTLNHVALRVITNNICRFAFPLLLQATNICTSGIGTVGVCRGDSGGPIVVTRNNGPVLVGVTSFGTALGCEAGLPSAFARVTSFIDFFNQHL